MPNEFSTRLFATQKLLFPMCGANHLTPCGDNFTLWTSCRPDGVARLPQLLGLMLLLQVYNIVLSLDTWMITN